MELVLLEWDDGRICLSFEERLEGKDRHFALQADGTTHEIITDDDLNETFIPVNLAIELRKMLGGAK